MLMLLICKLANRGAEHHKTKAGKCRDNKTEYAYHVRMMGMYTAIWGLAIKAGKLKK